MGGDLGSAFKGFKKAVKEDNLENDIPSAVDDAAEVMAENAKKEDDS
jgi:Sec-independent protein translocase protein TatA